MITISSFDPVRRQIARIAMENLIVDQRIQPAKIEDFVEKAKGEINRVMKEKADAALYEVGLSGIDPRLVGILGRLYFRTSYGQNVLQHSTEMAHIAGMMAAELGADVKIAKMGALFHDIGKAVDHEVQGTHVEIGRRILAKFNVDKRVILAMQAHHEEYPYETIESILVQVADAISGGRPGARRDSVERYIQRLTDLEAIAKSFDGVEKVYAIQAGRELRVFVTPEKISDMAARDLARNIAMRIENELKYPGEIKVNVIRETRTIEFAR
jgi:ribonuclease Y